MYQHFFMSNVVKDWLSFPTRSYSFSVSNKCSYSIWAACTVTFCKYMCCWGFFTKLDTMSLNNGIYRDATLLVDGWCAMACQHVHNLGEHAFIAWSLCCLKWWYKFHTTAARACSLGLRTCWHTITHQRSKLPSYIHSIVAEHRVEFCESLPTAHILTGCHSTTSFNRIGKCVANTKLQDLLGHGTQSFTTFDMSKCWYMTLLYFCLSSACME